MKPNLQMAMTPRLALILTVWLAVTGFASLEALFAPKADLWDRWQAHDPGSNSAIDHSPWDRLLKTYLTPREGNFNAFDYAGVTPADKKALKAYVDNLAATSVSRLNRAEQMAFWINLYNALTISVVLDHWPVSSIRDIDISPGLFADGPWAKKLVTIEDQEVSLNDIEHRILRPIWKDARIHYAVNCASIGCPDLAPKAYRATTLNADLDSAAVAYINDARGARFDPQGDLVVSKIYTWFVDDFGGSTETVLAHLRRYAQGTKRGQLEKTQAILGHDYDWRINAPSRP